MAEKDFVVKNGLVVNTNLIVADGDLNRVGINNSAPDASLTVTGTANVSGNVVFGANLLTVGISRSGEVQVGDNVVVNSTTMFVGNSTTNAVQTSTFIRVSNSTSTANLNPTSLTVGISTVNSTSIAVGSNVTVNSSVVSLGNSTVNVSINSTAFTGTANNSTNFNGQSAAFYANATNLTTGTLPSARLSGNYTGITNVGTLGTLTVSGNTSLSGVMTVNSTVTAISTNVNFDSGLFFVDGVNNRIGINNTTPDASLTITGSANVSGDLKVLGNLIITGNTISQGTQEFTGALTPSTNGIFLGNTTNRWNVVANSGEFSSLLVGNSTINVAINSTAVIVGGIAINGTAFPGTANSATNLNGQPASFYTNATNLTTGTLSNARLNSANTTQAGIVQLVDSVSNVSITLASTANAVKTAYDVAILANTRATSAQTAAASAYTNAVTFAANADNLTSGTVIAARLPTGNATTIGALQIVDSVSNVSATIAAAANSVSTTYNVALAANTRAASAQSAATSAYSNAIAIAANANNLTSGTVNAARLPTGNATTIGALQIVDSVVNTSATIAVAANSVKLAYDTAIAANTRAASAQTAAASAFTNATTFASNASNITTGTLASARISGAYTGITQVGTLTGLTATGNINFDSGVLFVDGTNNRVGVNTTSPSVSLQIAANDAIFVPIGNTAQRPTGANGMFRFNVDTSTFEGFSNGSWGTIAGSGAGGYYKGNLGEQGNTANKDNLYRINSNTQSNNITITAGENALTVGPMVIATGYNLTIQEGGRAVII